MPLLKARRSSGQAAPAMFVLEVAGYSRQGVLHGALSRPDLHSCAHHAKGQCTGPCMARFQHSVQLLSSSHNGVALAIAAMETKQGLLHCGSMQGPAKLRADSSTCADVVHSLWEHDVIIHRADIRSTEAGDLQDRFWITDNRRELPDSPRYVNRCCCAHEHSMSAGTAKLRCQREGCQAVVDIIALR